MAEIPGLHKIIEKFSREKKDPVRDLVTNLENSISEMEKYLSFAYEHDKELVFRAEDIKIKYFTNPMTAELAIDDRIKTDFKPLFFTEVQNFFSKIEKYLKTEKKNLTNIGGFVVQPVYEEMVVKISGKKCVEIPEVLRESLKKIFNFSEGLE